MEFVPRWVSFTKGKQWSIKDLPNWADWHFSHSSKMTWMRRVEFPLAIKAGHFLLQGIQVETFRILISSAYEVYSTITWQLVANPSDAEEPQKSHFEGWSVHVKKGLTWRALVNKQMNSMAQILRRDAFQRVAMPLKGLNKNSISYFYWLNFNVMTARGVTKPGCTTVKSLVQLTTTITRTSCSLFAFFFKFVRFY